MASAAAAKKCPRPSQPVGLPAADQPDVRLVDEGGRLEGLPGLLVGQPRGGQLPQLVVDEREQVGRGLRVAGLDGGQDLGDVGHDRHPTTGRTRSAAAFHAGGSPSRPARPAAHRSGRRSSTPPAGSDGSRAKASRR